MKFQTLNDVLAHEIQDLYSAETQITKAMPEIIEATTSEKLKMAFQKHSRQTADQIKRLEEVADMLGIKAQGEKCVGMEGLLEEGKKLIKEEPGVVLDAALIAASQRVEHYEIAGYGTAITFLETLGEEEAAEILKETLSEEKRTDSLLSEIAESAVNEQAVEE